jgi:hypothetical protein
MNTLSVPSCIRYCQVTRMGMLALTGMLFAACVGGPVDRADAVKIADVLKGKTK